MKKKIVRKILDCISRPERINSETSKVRKNLQKYCQGDGLDIGYGGDPITPSSICIDLPESYAKYRNYPQHLHGDAQNLKWFRDGVFDYVYSSHLLEDFEDTETVLIEWIRVLKQGGNLILFLPDEQSYRQYCRKKGKTPNIHHIHDNFSLEYVKGILKKRDDVEIIYEKFPGGIYSFELVLRKK
jgi:predicted SAM-dependent methyltransferase